MKAHHIKTSIVTIASSSILLSSATLFAEIEKPKSTEVIQEITVAEDPATLSINDEILNPLIAQSKKFNRFSRSGRSYKLNYELVETTNPASKETRTFQIIYTKGYVPIIAKTKTPAKVAHEIKYLTESNTLLVKQANDWVAVKDHKYLRLLPKLSTSEKDIAVKE